MMNYQITAVIVNWNRKRDVIALLESLSQLTNENICIVVVDNASTDGSVEALTSSGYPIIIVKNQINLGGTGGFNTGIRYALEHLQQEFIWLLDNDATVSPDSLTHLVAAMEDDPAIALTGSRIVNQNEPDSIVETGAFISWRHGNVLAVHRNVMNSNFGSDVIDVDYVAVCSALVRVAALSRVGLMDERYFLLWDDMDWGACFKKHGYRVVCATGSVVYHPAFTEKRSVVVDNYYGIRNPLLSISKYTKGITRLQGLFSILCRAGVLSALYWLSGVASISRLCRKAVADFLKDSWGKVDFEPGSVGCRVRDKGPIDTLYCKKVLILPTGNGDEINDLALFSSDFRNSGGKLCLLIQKDRRSLFEGKGFDEIVEFEPDMKRHLFSTATIFARLAFAGFDAAVKPSFNKVILLSFAIRKVYLFNPSDKNVSQTREGLPALPALIALLAICAIWILTAFPFVYLKSTQYHSQQEG